MDYLVKDFGTEFFQVKDGFLKTVTESEAVVRVIAVGQELVQVSFIRGHGQGESIFYISRSLFYELVDKKHVVSIESVFELDEEEIILNVQ